MRNPNRKNKKSAPASSASRKPRIFWASSSNLFDISSGPALACLEMLEGLAARGYPVKALSGSIFDSESGKTGLNFLETADGSDEQKSVTFKKTGIDHIICRFSSTNRQSITTEDQNKWFQIFSRNFSEFRPDIYIFSGDGALEMLASQYSSTRGTKCIAYIGNGQYRGLDWCYNVDLALTDSHATSELYRRRLNIEVQPIGTMIAPARVVAQRREPIYATFINPTIEKGALIVASLAAQLEHSRPDIKFYIVESRGNWTQIVQRYNQASGKSQNFSNVIVVPAARDMRSVFANTKILLAPSVAYESAGRVVAEAMLNGIPCMVTRNGGLPEVLGAGGIVMRYFEMGEALASAAMVPSRQTMDSMKRDFLSLWDYEPIYNKFATLAQAEAARLHSLKDNLTRLEKLLHAKLGPFSGDRDYKAEFQKRHRLYIGSENDEL